jgi:hypothetical protein
MGTKDNVVLYLDKDLVDKSTELGFNLSRTFENHLKQLISQRTSSQYTQNHGTSENTIIWWAEPDSDRRPSARQADIQYLGLRIRGMPARFKTVCNSSIKALIMFLQVRWALAF